MANNEDKYGKIISFRIRPELWTSFKAYCDGRNEKTNEAIARLIATEMGDKKALKQQETKTLFREISATLNEVRLRLE